MFQYIIISEFSNKKLGFIVDICHLENDANLLMSPVFAEFEAYSLNSSFDIPSYFFRKYQSYEFTGEEYFWGCDKYSDRCCNSNGDLTVSVIRCKGGFDFKAFHEYRNLPMYFGVMMN